MTESNDRPKLRPVEVFPAADAGREMLVVVDPTGWATDPIAVSPATVLILSLMDGEHDFEGIRRAFHARVGRVLPASQLERIIEQLDAAHYLDSARFQAFLRAQEAAYRATPTRKSAEPSAFGAGEEGLEVLLARLLADPEVVRPRRSEGRLVGLVAPHLDFARGRTCYADVYSLLVDRGDRPHRVVILGTNHFGRADSVVATRKDFETPLGVTRTDRDFIHALEEGIGADLCTYEFDHLREHSVELQVMLLQHILGPENFTIVPVLCPDACGAAEELDVFATRLGELVRNDASATLIVAGADLSHVGARFGDARELDEDFRREVERYDRAALDAIVAGDPAGFLSGVRAHENRTRICSTGCLYATVRALAGAQVELLRYHQAIDPEGQSGVTCASMVFWQD